MSSPLLLFVFKHFSLHFLCTGQFPYLIFAYEASSPSDFCSPLPSLQPLFSSLCSQAISFTFLFLQRSHKKDTAHTKNCFHRAEPWNLIFICKWGFPIRFLKQCPNVHQTQINTPHPHHIQNHSLKGMSYNNSGKLPGSTWEGNLKVLQFFHFAVALELHTKRLLPAYSWRSRFHAENMLGLFMAIASQKWCINCPV